MRFKSLGAYKREERVEVNHNHRSVRDTRRQIIDFSGSTSEEAKCREFETPEAQRAENNHDR
jgi:hypothetical protein